MIVFIIVVAVALNLLDIGGKPAQIIWLLVALVVVLWVRVWTPPRGLLHY